MLTAFLALNSCGDDEVIVLGCTDASATNYDPLATGDDGSCTFEQAVLGCTDASALNYNPLATEDDGSCAYSSDISWTENTQALPFGIGAMGFAKVPNGFMIWSCLKSVEMLSFVPKTNGTLSRNKLP